MPNHWAFFIVRHPTSAMQNPTIHYHSSTILIASGEIIPPPAHSPNALHSAQRTCVRTLLKWCLERFLPDYQLLASDYPYQLICKDKPSLFVCFSHSQHQVALIIATQPCGIDIELRPISPKIAKRFFHANELNHLHTLPQDEQTVLRATLWQLKESLVKCHNSTLSYMIGQDVLSLLSNQYAHWKGNTYWVWHSKGLCAVVASKEKEQ